MPRGERKFELALAHWLQVGGQYSWPPTWNRVAIHRDAVSVCLEIRRSREHADD